MIVPPEGGCCGDGNRLRPITSWCREMKRREWRWQLLSLRNLWVGDRREKLVGPGNRGRHIADIDDPRDRKERTDRRPFAGFAVDHHLAPVQLDHRGRKRKSEACAVMRAAQGAI